jgi:HEAT repeat protein
MRLRHFILIVASVGFLGAATAFADALSPQLTEKDREQCFEVLTAGLKEESLGVRVHAAEALIALHRPEPALKAFASLRDTNEPKDRILVWRVLARAEPERARRDEYVSKIRAALCDTNGPDQTHAMEALAKLNEAVADGLERKIVRAIADAADAASPFALWRLALSGDETAVDKLATLVAAKDSATRFRAIYVLARLRPKFPAARNTLIDAMNKEPADSSLRPMLRAAIGGDSLRQVTADETLPAADRYFAAMFLADCGTPADDPILKPLLSDSNSDVRIAAAYALLKINIQPPATAPATN